MKCPKCETINPADSKFCKECATPLPAGTKEQISFTRTLETRADELARGTLFAGRYEVIEELGVGGMGRVYRAHDTKLNEEVALKLIRPEIGVDKRTVERFHNEIKIARKIGHKNVCRIHDLHEEGRTLYLTMEYVRGEDLKSFIKRSKIISTGTAISIARQVAEGLSEAHKLGIVHRDLKPGNIMIDKEGQAKIMDFGIARAVREKGITGEGAIIGTPEYMSPEQVEGKEADQRTDLYALGVILFEMVTGRVPFEGETPFSIANKQKSEPPPIPKKLAPQIPEVLNRLILRCLEKDEAKRYQTAEELLTDLASVEESLPTAERIVPKRKAITHREVTVKFQPRKLVIPAAAFIIFIAAGIILWRIVASKKTAPAPSSTGQPTLAVLNFENKSGDSKLDSWRDALAELLIEDLMQSKYIRVISGEEMFTTLKRLGLADARRYSSEDIDKIAAQARATHVLRGSFIKAGESFIITAGLQKPGTGASSTPLRFEASNEKDIIVKVDELTRQIKEGLNLSAAQIAGDIEKDAGKITTFSPEALKYYIDGRKYMAKMEFEKGAAYMEKAVQIDPEFAMAYRALTAAYGNLGKGVKSWNSLRKALELSSRLPDNERLLIECIQHRWNQEFAKAIEAGEKLVKEYPESSMGHGELCLAYLAVGDFDEAIRHEELAVQIRRTPVGVNNLAASYNAKGLFQKTEDLILSLLQDGEESDVIREPLCTCFLCRKQFDRAFAEAEKLSFSHPDNISYKESIGNVLLLKGDIAGAEKIYQQIYEKDPVAVMGARYRLALIRGKYTEASRLNQQGLDYAKEHHDTQGMIWPLAGLIDISEKCGRLEDAKRFFAQYLQAKADFRQSRAKDSFPYGPSWQKDDLFFKGSTQALLNSFDEAQKTAEELKAMIDKGISTRERMEYEIIQGLIELGEKNYSRAADEFGRACSRLASEAAEYFQKSASYIDYLARALFESGNLDKSRQEYEKITLLTLGRLDNGDIYAKSFYMLGKIAEQQGKKAEARENYRKFLDLWKDANPGLPEVEDAKKRLESLSKI